jgi:thiol-disulfide isomerase/thioredoxin
MSDDRGNDGGWWPGDRDEGPAEPPPDRDRDREPGPPPRGLESRDRPRPSGRYSMFVGLAFVALIVVALLNLLNDDNAGIELERGLPLAEFAVPDALAGIDADANIAQDDCESSRNPCPEGDRRTPACRIDTEGAIRVCDLFDRPLAISFWFTRGGDCIPTQNAFDQVARRYRGRVNFLSVDVRDDPGTVAGIARDNGWKVPVGLDRDGAVSNLYRVGVCPTIVLAYPGGIVYDTAIRAGNFETGEIDDLAGRLLAASREREREVR